MALTKAFCDVCAFWECECTTFTSMQGKKTSAHGAHTRCEQYVDIVYSVSEHFFFFGFSALSSFQLRGAIFLLNLNTAHWLRHKANVAHFFVRISFLFITRSIFHTVFVFIIISSVWRFFLFVALVHLFLPCYCTVACILLPKIALVNNLQWSSTCSQFDGLHTNKAIYL